MMTTMLTNISYNKCAGNDDDTEANSVWQMRQTTCLGFSSNIKDHKLPSLPHLWQSFAKHTIIIDRHRHDCRCCISRRLRVSTQLSWPITQIIRLHCWLLFTVFVFPSRFRIFLLLVVFEFPVGIPISIIAHHSICVSGWSSYFCIPFHWISVSSCNSYFCICWLFTVFVFSFGFYTSVFVFYRTCTATNYNF